MRADTVVIGAGAAGATIAARMTEDGRHEVLLLEAGPDYPEEIPSDLRNGTRNSMKAHDWGFHHLPTREQPPFVFPRGKVVGGSTAVNTCIALRGEPYDYNEWELDDWRWERCEPAFRRLERDLDYGDRDYHGADGPIPIRRHPHDELTPWQAAFLEACETLGFARCDDSNEPGTTGYGPHAMNKVDGQRMSAALGYLDAKTRARSNLRIVAGVLVRRILFDGKRVRGVEIERNGAVETVATKRVVLSAGSIGTPGVLLRSGVGSAEDVARIGVALVAENPWVNKHLLDHPGCAIFLLPQPGVAEDTHLIQNVLRYKSRRNRQRNDMILQPGSFVPLPVGDTMLVSLMAAIGKPRGAGWLRYESADPHAKPRIHSEFLRDPDDLDMAMEAMELAWLLATSTPMRSMARCLMPTERGLVSRESMRSWIYKQTGSGYHPCGTVPMGSSAAKGATDSRGRVFGVEGLIVADASLYPTVPSCNINVPTLMLGERFGEWLRDGDL